MAYENKLDLLKEQYSFVTESRSILLNYCETISAEHFVTADDRFGRGSIRNLLVHVANIYELWIGSRALQMDIAFTSFEGITNVRETIDLFKGVDRMMNEFFDRIDSVFTFDRDGFPFSCSALQLFTHVITHEFHHKGQILTLSRFLGYTPVDTDVIR